MSDKADKKAAHPSDETTLAAAHALADAWAVVAEKRAAAQTAHEAFEAATKEQTAAEAAMTDAQAKLCGLCEKAGNAEYKVQAAAAHKTEKADAPKK